MRRINPVTIAFAVVAMILATACTEDVSKAATESTPAPPPQQTQPETTHEAKLQPPDARPTATMPDGRQLSLELATTPDEIANGLMFRPALPPDHGMLFVFGQERLPAFWMKNTLIPLDMVFLDSRGAVVDVVKNAQPCRADPCPQYVPKHPAAAVLELAAGQADAYGIADGATLVFDRVAGYPAS